MEILLLARLVPEARAGLDARHPVDYRPDVVAAKPAVRKAIYKVRAACCRARWW